MYLSNMIKYLVPLIVIAFVIQPAYADLADQLEDLVGYTIIDSKTIEG